MTDRDEKMALWIAFTISIFSADELDTLCSALQTKLEELQEIIDG